MKNTKKGLSLLAAAAFLALSLVPMGALAAPPELPVLTTSQVVTVPAGSTNVQGQASEAAQYGQLPTASPAVIMPGQELQLQVSSSLPAEAPVESAVRNGWYYGATAEEAAASQNAVPNAPSLPTPGATAPPLTIRGTAAPVSPSPSASEEASQTPSASPDAEASSTAEASESPSESPSVEPSESPSAAPATDVAAGTTRGYSYVVGPYAPQTGSTAQTWWGAGFSVQCVQPELTWSGLYSSVTPGASDTASQTMVAGQTSYATIAWSGAVPPVSAGSTVGNPSLNVTVTDSTGNAAQKLVCNLPSAQASTRTQVEMQAAFDAPGGLYTVRIAPQATVPAEIQSIAKTESVRVLGYELAAGPGGTTGTVGQRGTSVVQWSAANNETCAGAPADAARLIYRWTAQQTPAPKFSDGVYDPQTGTITSQTAEPITSMAGSYQYTVQAYYPATAGVPETAVGQPVVVTLGNISNYTLVPIEAEKNGVVVAVGSKAASSVAWAAGSNAQTPDNPSALVYEWTATGTNAAAAPKLVPVETTASGAVATAQSEAVLTLDQTGTYTYSVQAYDTSSGTRVPVGSPAAITMTVVIPELQGDPAILRATSQTAPEKVLRVRWNPNAAPTDQAWLDNIEYTWTPQTEDASNWPVVDVTTKQPSNALRSNFEGGSPNVYVWSVQAVYTDPATGRKTNIGSPVKVQLDLYAENVLVAAYETDNAFTTKVGESASMSVVWANGFVKTGETYTWTPSEGAPAIDPPSTSTDVTTAVTTMEQGGKTFTYSVQPYTASGTPDGDPAKVELYVQQYMLKPTNAAPSVRVGETVQLEAAWSSEGGAAVPAEDAQITYVWSGPEPEDGPAVTGNGLTATVAAAKEEGEWTYTLTAQTGTAPNVTPIATAQFVVTAIDSTPGESSSLEPLVDSGVTISTLNNVKYIVGRGLTVTATGYTVDDVISMMHTPLEGYEIRITTAGGTVKGDDAIVGTGDIMQLVSTENGDELEQAVIVVRGDVSGSGKMTLTQLVQMASALTGEKPLEGANLMAGDLDGSGKINLTDLVQEAAMYKTEIMNPQPSSTATPAPITTPEPSTEPSASASPSQDASATPDASATASASASPSASSSPEA